MLYHPKSANRVATTKNTVLGPAMLALTTALALGATGCGRGSAQGGQAQTEEAQKVPAPRTVAATAREIPVTLALDGTLLADEDSNLASVVSGR